MRSSHGLCLIDHIRFIGHFGCHGDDSSLHVMFIAQKCHLLSKLDIKWSRYDLTNIYTIYMGPYEGFALEPPPIQMPHIIENILHC